MKNISGKQKSKASFTKAGSSKSKINRRVFTTVRFRLQNQYILSYDNYSGHHSEYGSFKESICLTLRRVLRDTADGEIILDEIIVFHTILYVPRHKRLALLLECRRVIVDGDVEVVHKIRTYPSGQGRVGKRDVITPQKLF